MTHKFEKAYHLPFSMMRFGNFVFDAKDSTAFQILFSHDEDENKVSKANAQNLIEIINGISEPQNNHEFVYTPSTGYISMDGNNIILIRGWGYLTGIGGLNLEPSEAAEIQDDLAKYIIKKLTLTNLPPLRGAIK